MLISEYRNLQSNDSENSIGSLYDWHIDCVTYSSRAISEMPNWINRNKDDFTEPLSDKPAQVNVSSFTEMQKLAYDMIIFHSKKRLLNNPLLLIVNGVVGTGKSYLITALRQALKRKCIITATTGKAAFNISGVTIHSLLKLPITNKHQKDLTDQSLVALQERLATIDYIFIDEYSC